MAAIENLGGMVIPLPTPFKDDGEVDVAQLAEMSKFYVNKGADGYFLLGSFGQGPALRPDQRKTALETVVNSVGTDFPLVAHIGAVDPYTARDLAMHADQLGVTAVAMVGPYYYSDRSLEELALHFKFVDDAITTPLFLYNNPAYQGYPLSASQVRQISDRTSGFVGVKIAKGTLAEAQAYREAFGDGIRLFAPANNLSEGLGSGALNGSISPPLALAPELGVAAMAAIRRKDAAQVESLQGAINDYISVLHSLREYGRAAHAVGLRHLGFDVKYPRWPTRTVPAELAVSLQEAIDKARAAGGAALARG